MICDNCYHYKPVKNPGIGLIYITANCKLYNHPDDCDSFLDKKDTKNVLKYKISVEILTIESYMKNIGFSIRYIKNLLKEL